MYLQSFAAIAALLWCAPTVHAQYFPITGTQTGRGRSGSRPERQNILDMQNDVAKFSLYIQALTRMQALPENDPQSWYQIAGIHGRPYISWNNVGNSPGAPAIGYCTHNSVLFTTWHRPYLVLMEQILSGHVQAIAKTYPPSLLPTYQAAADNFRLPYWDWGLNSDMPNVVTTMTVQINTPTGFQVVTNPLASYTFKAYPFGNVFTAQDSYPQYRTTARDPTNTVNDRLRNEGFQKRTWQAIAKSKDFNSFSTAGTVGLSVEAVHNSVHGDIGLHMSTLTQSAFDPIFWLHHTNIDRLFAIWQAINPSVYLTPMFEQQGTWTIRSGAIDTSSTPLTPFTQNTAGTFFTSDTARSLSPFGYTYPEIQDWTQTPDQLRANVTAQLNRLYNPRGAFTKRAPAGAESHAPGSTLRTWSVRVSLSKLDLKNRTMVRVFVGEPPVDPKEWFTTKKCAGSVFVHPAPGAGSYYERLGEEAKIVVHDEVDLEGLLEQGGVDAQDKDAVVKFLRDGLQWRVQSTDGTPIPIDQVPSLRIALQEEEVTLAESIEELPTYGKKTLHPEVTRGRAGGFQGSAAG